jgi:hypothetical protein
MEIWMTPPHWQVAMQSEVNAGKLATSTVGIPGTQGAVVTGTHGMGVSAPSAAAVAAATVGLAMLIQVPNGGMFRIGLLSMIDAIGCST